jgi:tetraacyldisaccharide-1-P 4'-kinase
MIDGASGFGNGQVLPRGLLRNFVGVAARGCLHSAVPDPEVLEKGYVRGETL